MQKIFSNLLSDKKSTILPTALNVISLLFALRGIVKSKSIFWSLLNMVSAGISGYLLVKNARGILKKD